MSPLAEAILELAHSAGPAGASLGSIVDELEARGYAAERVEQELWRLMGLRRLTPCGFVCRKVLRRDPTGELLRLRTYEMRFTPWSEQLDRQLDLQLDDGDGETPGSDQERDPPPRGLEP
ncbi:MAG: hypothetical protein AB1Z98_29900 [Nannocystaceae bacterium]